MTENRLIALEEQLAYQEHTIADLNQALYLQHNRIDSLERRCEELAERLRQLGEELPSGSGALEPPHY